MLRRYLLFDTIVWWRRWRRRPSQSRYTRSVHKQCVNKKCIFWFLCKRIVILLFTLGTARTHTASIQKDSKLAHTCARMGYGAYLPCKHRRRRASLSSRSVLFSSRIFQHPCSVRASVCASVWAQACALAFAICATRIHIPPKYNIIKESEKLISVIFFFFYFAVVIPSFYNWNYLLIDDSFMFSYDFDFFFVRFGFGRSLLLYFLVTIKCSMVDVAHTTIGLPSNATQRRKKDQFVNLQIHIGHRIHLFHYYYRSRERDACTRCDWSHRKRENSQLTEKRWILKWKKSPTTASHLA